MRWLDIEVPNIPVDMNSWGTLACYPWRTFYPLSRHTSTWYVWVTTSNFRFCSNCFSRSQACFHSCVTEFGNTHLQHTFELPRYYLGGLRPKSTTKQRVTVNKQYFIKGSRFFTFLYFSRKSGISLLYAFTYSHLFYTFSNLKGSQLIVKVHRVSSSPDRIFASSRRFQFHRVRVWDSRTIVTPFMQDANYAPRNFATLERLVLPLPFAWVWLLFHEKNKLWTYTGQASGSIHGIST